MHVTQTHAEGLKREYQVVVASDEIDRRIEDRLKEIGRDARIPGFRPGKAPMSILRQRFGQAVMGEVLEKTVDETSQQAMAEEDLRPAQQPKIELESFDTGSDLQYKMSMELLPDIEPMDFSQLELERLNIQVPDAEVEKALEHMATQAGESSPIEEARPAANGDVVVIDFQGTVDGEAFPGMDAEDHHLELGSTALIPGFEDQLIGAEAGETREVRVTFPDDYGNEALAGKEAVFQVTVKEIREKVAQEIGDEMAQKFGTEDLNDLRDKIRQNFAQHYDQTARQKTKRELLDKLADNHSFTLPPSMVEAEFEQIWQQIEQDRAQGRLDPEDAEKDEDALKSEYRDIAERRVRLGLLLSEVGRLNEIQVSQDELNQALIQEAQRYPGQEQQVFEYYQSNPQALNALRAPVYEDKVVDYILELASVTARDVTPEQLQAELSGESADSGAEGEAETKNETAAQA